MVGRKLSAAALVSSIAVAALIAGCRDDAPTGTTATSSVMYAANLRVQAGDVQTGAVALPLPSALRVKVIDAGGNPVQGASVIWRVLAGGGSVNPPTGVSDANGFVSTTWTLGTSLGANTVRAYLSTSFLLDSATFGATAINGTGVTITVDSTTLPGASARVASTLTPLAFAVTDQFGHPVPGATVTFTPGPGSGTVAPTAGVTDVNGIVHTVWTLGNTATTQTITATLTGELPVTIAEPTTADTSRRIVIVSGNNQSAPAAGNGSPTALPLGLTVQVTDRFNNPIAGEAVTFGDSIGNGSVVTQANPLTDASGFANGVWKLGALAGPQVMRVRTPGSGGQFVRFSANATVQFRDVFVGNFFTCGVGTNNLAYCWGFGQDGQLGNIGLVSRNAPNWPVTSTDTLLLAAFTTFRSVSGGQSHACGVSISQRIFCWGVNSDGRQFMLPPTNPSPKATDVSAPNFAGNTQLASARSVSAGEAFSCALTLGGLAFCSGNNELGQLGTGAVSALLGTTLVDTSLFALGTPRPHLYSAIVAGSRHACGFGRMPALPAPQVVFPWCWGQNISGQLGNSSVIDSFRPQPVTPPGALALTGFDSTSLVAGAAHTCALSAPLPGAAYCWGSNAFGQLGVGAANGAPTTAPVAVTGGVLFVRLYAGLYHTCGLTAAGQAFCWGRNSFGQLGDGTTIERDAPVAVGNGLLFGNLAMGEQHTCGITSAVGPGPGGTTGAPGTIFCWGDNEFGQAGVGLFGANTVPLLVPTRVSFQQ